MLDVEEKKLLKMLVRSLELDLNILQDDLQKMQKFLKDKQEIE